MNKERIIKFIAGLSLFLFTVTTQCKGPNQLYGEVPIMLLLGCVFLAILILCIITACMFFYFLDNVTFKKSLLLSIIINAIPIFLEILYFTLQIAFYNPDHFDYNAYPALWFTIGGTRIMWIYLFTDPRIGLLLGVLITIYTLKICFKYPYKKLLIPVLIVNVIIAFLLWGVKLGGS